MGVLLDGRWIADDGQLKRENHFVNRAGQCARELENWIEPNESAKFAPAAGRFVLYASLTCPFAHRALLARAVKRLDEHIDLVLTEPLSGSRGWTFAEQGRYADTELGKRALYEVYLEHDPHFSGATSVPVLWDRSTRAIVSNRSLDIARMIGACFEQWAENTVELYPAARQQEIDSLIRAFETEFTRPTLIAGSTDDQNEYEKAVQQVFAWLAQQEARLEQQRYLTGNTVSLADLVMFTGLVRFDSVYHAGCLCNSRRVQDFPNLWAYTRDIYQLRGVAATVDIESYRQSFFLRSPLVTRRIVPVGPDIDFDLPHDRAERFG